MAKRNGRILIGVGILIIVLGRYVFTIDHLIGGLSIVIGTITVINGWILKEGEDSKVEKWAKQKREQEIDQLKIKAKSDKNLD